MLKRTNFTKVLSLIVMLLVFFIGLPFLQTASASSTLQFNDESGSFYNYCPSYIQSSSTERYMFYCKNQTSGVITDSIYYRKATYNGSTWTWGSQSVALQPSGSGWDSIHVCDPDVKQGSFNYNGHNYSFVMFYLGCDQTDNSHNQIGVAFADSLEGPWVKYSANPLLSFSDTTNWGLGQPSATSVDGAGRLLLFYTRGESWTDSSKTYICRRDINLSDMANPSLGTEYKLFSNGLTEKDASAVFFHNLAFAYDSATDRFYISRDRSPSETTDPDYISTEVQVAYTSGANIWNNSGTWTVEGNITPDLTGNTRNHNSCLLTDTWGNLIGGSGNYQIAYTCSNTGAGNLWGYRIYSAPKSDLTNINKIDGQNRAITYSGTWTDYFDNNISTWYMGTDKYTSTPGSYFQCTFTGTNISYYGSQSSDNGKADIYIDNLFNSTIDTYNSNFNKSVLLWSITGLTNGTHTIKVVVRSDKNPLSSGYNKDLDYLKIN